MNSRTKTALAVCLAVSIFAGFVPWFLQAQAEFKIKSSNLKGSITCDGSTVDAFLDFFAETGRALGKGDVGLIEIFVPKEVRAPSTGSFSNGRFSGEVTDVRVSSNSFDISALIFQEYCGRPTTFVELSPSGFSSDKCNGEPFDVIIKYTGRPGASDTGRFFGRIKCSEVPGSPVQSPGTSQSDTIVGTNANNLIDGEGGNDILNGLAGNDKIIGGDGSDKMNGGDGKDFLVGGDGNDELTGGKGADLFQCGAGNDKITDFKPSEGDKKTSDCEQF